MHPRWVIALAVVAGAALGAKPALAWQEVHEVGDDVRVAVDEAGAASIEHRVRWHVVHGPIASIDLAGVDAAAVLEPAVAVTADDGRLVSNGHAARQDATTVRVVVDDPKALARGTFVFAVRWRLDLAATGGLARDGGGWRLTLRSPVAADGFDAARTFVDLPAAPDPPRAIDPETGAVDAAALATLERGPLRDALQLLHPHVARGQAVVWTVRADPRAFRGGETSAGPVALAAAAPEPDRVRVVLSALLCLGLGALFAWLVGAKERAASAAAAAHGGRVRPLIPLRPSVVATLGGAALAGALGLEMASGTAALAPVGPGGHAVLGALLAAAILAAALRVSPGAAPPRAAGRWLALRPDDAFAPAVLGPRDLFDVDGVRGRLATLGALALVAVAATVSRYAAGADAPWLVAIDAAALAPLFLTGRASQLGAARGREAARWLGAVFARLRCQRVARVVPWARVAIDGSVDELRLLVTPAVAAAGLVGLELGVGWRSTSVGWAMVPGVLVRVREGSAAAARVAQAAPGVRAALGRRREERVFHFTAPSPSKRDAVDLVRALAARVTDRRDPSLSVPWSGRERRRGPVTAPPGAETPRAHQQAC